MRQTWLEKYGRSCKIGTMPAVLRVNGTPRVGKWLRVQYVENGKWERVLVTYIDETGYFRADR